MLASQHYQLSELLLGLAHAMDLVSPALTNHHKRVGYMGYMLASELGLPDRERSMIAAAGLLHDSGALSLRERLDVLQFEVGPNGRGGNDHAYMGYVLLRPFGILSDVAHMVRHHHLWWERAGDCCSRKDLLTAANLLHVADRVDVLVDRGQEILGQVPGIRERIKAQAGRMFSPDLVEAFDALSHRESFWLDTTSSYLPTLVRGSLDGWSHRLNGDEFLALSKLLSTVIDFRSRFTATHSAGVAASAEALAGECGFGPAECRMMRLAGYLHDLGKLAVPAEILEKPAKLSPEEFAVIRSHTYHTFRVLQTISGLDTVNSWASFHHERLDGKGYPFHHGDDVLSLGARIMAMADVLTAVTEDRPYRAGMQP